MYSTSKANDCWKGVLGNDYEFGLQLLLAAVAAFDIDRSAWMRNQNSFNDMIVRGFVAVLSAKRILIRVKLVDRRGRLVKYGVLLQGGGPPDRLLPTATKGLREFNARRNKLPGSHPYDEKDGARNKFLSKKERNAHARALRLSLSEIVRVSAARALV